MNYTGCDGNLSLKSLTINAELLEERITIFADFINFKFMKPRVHNNIIISYVLLMKPTGQALWMMSKFCIFSILSLLSFKKSYCFVNKWQGFHKKFSARDCKHAPSKDKPITYKMQRQNNVYNCWGWLPALNNGIWRMLWYLQSMKGFNFAVHPVRH